MATSLDCKKTLADVRALNRSKGFYFFDADTMKFWRSKVHGGLIKGRYFITSEDNFNRTARLFTVRVIDWRDGDIDTVGDFQAYATLAEAKRAAHALAD